MKKPITYREKIQEMISSINKLYEESEYMRDVATLQEKKYWNRHRSIFYYASKPLCELDNSLSDERASIEINQ